MQKKIFIYIRKCYSTTRGDYDALAFSVVPYGIATKDSYGASKYKEKLAKSFKDFLSLSKKALATNLEREATFILFGGGSFDKDVQSVFFNYGIFPEAYSKHRIKISRDINSFPKNYFIQELALNDVEKKRLVIATQLANPNHPQLAILPIGHNDKAPQINDPIITKTTSKVRHYIVRNGMIEWID